VIATLLAAHSSAGGREERHDAADRDPERRITVLFRRWPALSSGEMGELRRLWDERIRRSKRRRDETGSTGRA
jgi:hypothetical protein